MLELSRYWNQWQISYLQPKPTSLYSGRAMAKFNVSLEGELTNDIVEESRMRWTYNKSSDASGGTMSIGPAMLD